MTANFRETQLDRMRLGQRATLARRRLDRDYQGTVASFAGATGSRYSLLPPENATGNYVKVVQRIPVRINLDAGQPGSTGCARACRWSRRCACDERRAARQREACRARAGLDRRPQPLG